MYSMIMWPYLFIQIEWEQIILCVDYFIIFDYLLLEVFCTVWVENEARDEKSSYYSFQL